MGFFKSASQNDSKEIAAAAALKAAPKGAHVATFVGMSYKPASQETSGGISFMFRANTLERPIWVNGNPTDRVKWNEVNKNGSIWDARKVLYRTIEFVETLHMLGCLGQYDENDELGDGDAVGDWYYKVPIKQRIGRVAIQFNFGEHNGKSVRNARKSGIVEHVPEDISQLTLNGSRELQHMLYSIPKDCLAWILEQIKSQELVKLETDMYRLRIETIKEATDAKNGSEEVRIICTSWRLDDPAPTDGLRTYFRFAEAKESDVMLLQALQQVVGTDPEKTIGQFFDAMVIKGVSQREGSSEFSWNYFQDIYAVDTTVSREGLPQTQQASNPAPQPATKDEDDVSLEDDGPFAAD